MTTEPHSELRVQRLKKRIADFTLEADFSVAPGERAVLVGRSGSGKTTLLRLVAGLERLDGSQDAGEIFLGRENLTRLSPQERGIGVVFQEQALFPSLNVLENAAFGLRMRGVSAREREKLARPWLERVGLAHRIHASVGTLSGGERQRVAFVRALVFRPRMLLLDEPFSALDTALRETLRRELVALHEAWPVPLLFVTHDPADVGALATMRLEIAVEGEGQVRRIIRA